jgi:hypothetical protein
MPIALVAHTSSSSAVGASSAIDTTGATLLLAMMGGDQASQSGVTDSKGNTWTLVRPRKPATNAAEVALFECWPTSVGSGHTFTPTGIHASGCFAAFSGVDRNYAVLAKTPSTTNAPGSLVLPTTSGLVLAGLSFEAITTISIDSSFTITNQVNFIAGTTFGSAFAYKLTASGTVAPTWSWSGSMVAVAAMWVYPGTVPAPASVEASRGFAG